MNVKSAKTHACTGTYIYIYTQYIYTRVHHILPLALACIFSYPHSLLLLNTKLLVAFVFV